MGLNTNEANGNSTVMDLINNYFEDELLHEYRCSCKSLNSAIARKVVNRPSVISFVLKRYTGNAKTTKCRNNVFPSQEIDLNNHMATIGSTLYKPRAIILHQGENLTCGHYTTVIIYDDTEILIDNEKISFKKVNLSEGEILKDSYILIYENQNYVSNLIDKWTPVVFLLMIFTAHTQEIGCSQLLPLFTQMWKTFTETQKFDFDSILLYFISSQFARQVTMEHFISDNAVNEPAELLNKLLLFLNLHGDHITSISFMEQIKCRKC